MVFCFWSVGFVVFTAVCRNTCLLQWYVIFGTSLNERIAQNRLECRIQGWYISISHLQCKIELHFIQNRVVTVVKRTKTFPKITHPWLKLHAFFSSMQFELQMMLIYCFHRKWQTTGDLFYSFYTEPKFKPATKTQWFWFKHFVKIQRFLPSPHFTWRLTYLSWTFPADFFVQI